MRIGTAVAGLALMLLAASPVPGPARRGVAREKAKASPDAGGPVVFTDVAAKGGLKFTHERGATAAHQLPETMGSGVAWLDYDNDGWMDLYVVQSGPFPPNGSPPAQDRLYRNNGNGTFTDVTAKAGLKDAAYGMGVVAADYDNDGYVDLFVTNFGRNILYHNNGNGTFTDVTDKAGVAGSGWSTSAAWVDLDGDGRLDLVVLRYLQWDFDDIYCGQRQEGYRAYCHPDAFPAISPLVYHNDGNGHFTEIAQKAGLAHPGKGLGIDLADYDRDGRVDLFIANDSMSEFLYHNKSNGSFEEVALASGVAVDGEGHTYAGMGVDFADYNNDGLPDLVVTDLASQMYALYRNNGDGSFTYDSYPSGLGRMTMGHSGWGVRFIDYDNDGWKDLLITQGHDLDTVQLNF